jgi:hypothetical protein
MADALQILDETWSGFAAKYMLHRAVVEMDTVNKGCINVVSGIRKKFTLPRIEVTNLVQRRVATPAASDTEVTVDAKVINPQDFMLFYKFNPRDFETHFYAEDLPAVLLQRGMPPVAQVYMIMQTMKRFNEFLERATWRGRIQYDVQGSNIDPTTKGAAAGDAQYFYFDGLIKKILDDATTLQVATPVALTAANIRDKFTAALDLVAGTENTQALLGRYGKGGLKFMVSYVDFQKYGEALRTDTYKNTRSDEKAYTQYRGYEIETLAGLPENTFVLCIAKPDTDSNLWLGVNTEEDQQALQMDRTVAYSEEWFVKGLFKADTQIGFGDQLVIYTTQTA